MLPDLFREKKPVVLTDFVKELNDLGKAKYLFSEIVALVKLFLVLPVTTATSERTFSALRRLQTFLRATMTEKRMNNLLILNVYKERTDSLDLRVIAKWFISKSGDRERMFSFD